MKTIIMDILYYYKFNYLMLFKLFCFERFFTFNFVIKVCEASLLFDAFAVEHLKTSHSVKTKNTKEEG